MKANKLFITPPHKRKWQHKPGASLKLQDKAQQNTPLHLTVLDNP
ncbi:hypothetical protein SynBIOSE41_02316 [Synechococcus sp. BIOS-E4-1]|nr:hypothetical protein SynBIOSE41_02316 [Synechococcus sp. BIOS-E4-1]